MFIVWRQNHAPQAGSFDSSVNTVGTSLWNCLAPRRSFSTKFWPLIFLFPIVSCINSHSRFALTSVRKTKHLIEEEIDSGTKLIPEWKSNRYHINSPLESHQKGAKKACKVDCRSKNFFSSVLTMPLTCAVYLYQGWGKQRERTQATPVWVKILHFCPEHPPKYLLSKTKICDLHPYKADDEHSLFHVRVRKKDDVNYVMMNFN